MKELRQMPEGRYGDGKTGFRGQKDIKTKIIERKREDRKTKGHFVGAGVARIEVLLQLSTVIFRF